MKEITRRDFNQRILMAGVATALGAIAGSSVVATGLSCDSYSSKNIFEHGNHLENLPFLDEGQAPLNNVIGEGLSGRKFFDLATLTPETMITPKDQFYVRTLYPDQLKAKSPGKISMRGLAKEIVELTLQDLLPKVTYKGIHLMECAGNDKYSHFGLISSAVWSGVSVTEVLDSKVNLKPDSLIQISGYDNHSKPSADSVAGASWLFRLRDLESTRAFFATAMNGMPLSNNHGFPIRLVVPGWYGCCCIKWVKEIAVVPATVPSTSQMIEFASRTHQFGTPKLARDFEPAVVDLAALPVRVEKWLVDKKIVYRVIGVVWGGKKSPNSLLIRFQKKTQYQPVDNFKYESNETWQLWNHTWQPKAPGRYRIQLKVGKKNIPTRRLDVGYYARTVDLKEV